MLRLIRVLVASVEERRLRRALDEFEHSHNGLPSDRLMEAFLADGVLDETDEFHIWSQTYATWLTVTE